MTDLRIQDVRSQMPGGLHPPAARRTALILGLAIHHSATASASGASLDTARTLFAAQVQARGWDHGAYHYVIRPTGRIEYALDESIPGYHAGFDDPGDALNLERGQFWNQHYLAVCLVGWFENDRRARDAQGRVHLIPNQFTRPTQMQWQALVGLARRLCERHAIPSENVRGHRELAGCRTRCPGANLDLEALRAAVRAPDPAALPPSPR